MNKSPKLPVCYVNGQRRELPAELGACDGRVFKSGPETAGALPIVDAVVAGCAAGLTAKQIADAFGIDPANVAGKLNRTQGAKSSEKSRLFVYRAKRFELSDAGWERYRGRFG